MKLQTTLADGTKLVLIGVPKDSSRHQLSFRQVGNINTYHVHYANEDVTYDRQIVLNIPIDEYKLKLLGTLSTRDNTVDFEVNRDFVRFIQTNNINDGNVYYDYIDREWVYKTKEDSFISLVKSLEKEVGLLEKNPYGEESPDTTDAYYITSWHKFNSNKYEKDLKQWRQAIPAKWLVLIESK